MHRICVHSADSTFERSPAQFPLKGEAVFRDKRVGVIGTGATDGQIIEPAGPLAAHRVPAHAPVCVAVEAVSWRL